METCWTYKGCRAPFYLGSLPLRLWLKMTSFVDGRAIKLRASCDPCNEAKVRCSQTKPSCARCEKNDIPCVYGLSRRSHRNAPRVGTSWDAANPTQLSDDNHNNNNNASNHSSRRHSQSITPAPTAVSSPALSQPSHTSLPFQPMPSPPRAYTTDFTDILATGYDFLDFPATSPNTGDASIHGDFSQYDFQLERQDSSIRAGCDCVPRLIKELASMPSTSGNETASFDTQLSQLRRVINVSEDCISCHCTTQDDTSIRMQSTLLKFPAPAAADT